MGRIRDAYVLKFRRLMKEVRARQPERGVQWLLQTAERLSQDQNLPLHRGLMEVHERTRQKIQRWSERQHSSRALNDGQPARVAPHFVCDAGLGGLARWLRAAGYEAFWVEHIDDSALIREAARRSAILLTTDSLLMERRLLRDGIIPGFWLPPTIEIHEQLALVLREFDLALRTPRCMGCGGQLRAVDKESVRERIPPKTYVWRNEFFVCERCDKLFWYGTHWDKITTRLKNAAIRVGRGS